MLLTQHAIVSVVPFIAYAEGYMTARACLFHFEQND